MLNTPGPWRVEKVSPNANHFLRDAAPLVIMASEEDVAYVSLCEDTEFEANAALLAAAPLLRDALLAVEEHHVIINRRAGRPEERSHTLALVRAALAKVRTQ